eukprot:scaffold616212_cov24-Prasinocladus_malaysianus.AAC.1
MAKGEKRRQQFNNTSLPVFVLFVKTADLGWINYCIILVALMSTAIAWSFAWHVCQHAMPRSDMILQRMMHRSLRSSG